MKALAEALVEAVAHIAGSDESDDWEEGGDEDQDVRVLEAIAGYLSEATEAERDALSEAAERAARGVPDGHPRAATYRQWMEHMFGEGWQGNRRSDETAGD